MATVSEFRIRGLVWHKDLPYPIDNTFIVYGTPTIADINEEINTAGALTYAPDGVITTTIQRTNTFKSKSYMTRAELRKWIRNLWRVPTKSGYYAYFYAIAIRSDRCYSDLDYKVCVPSDVDFEYLHAAVNRIGVRLQYTHVRDRISIGTAGECVPDVDWLQQINNTIEGLNYHRTGGEPC